MKWILTVSFVLYGAFALGGAKTQYVVVNETPPSVLLVDGEGMTTSATIDIPERPGPFVLSPSGDKLYVVHHPCNPRVVPSLLRAGGPASRLSIVDLKTGRVETSKPLSWNVTELSISEDGRRVVAVGAGRADKKKPNPDEVGMVHVLDTQTSELESIPLAATVDSVAITRDHSRVFALVANESDARDSSVPTPPSVGPTTLPACRAILPARTPRAGSFALKIIDVSHRPAVAKDVTVPGTITGMVLSSDERWVYLFDPGEPFRKKSPEAKLYVIDAATGEIAQTHTPGIDPIAPYLDPTTGQFWITAHRTRKDHNAQIQRYAGAHKLEPIEAGADPLWVVHSEQLGRPLLVAKDRVCPIVADGNENRCVDVRPLKPTELSSGPVRGTLLEIDGVPNSSALVLRTGEDGERLAFADLSRGTVSSVMTVGRPGARATKMTARGLGLGAVTGLLALGCGGAGPNCRGIPDVWGRSDGWVRTPAVFRPDGKFVYVTNTYSGDLAVVDTEARVAASYIPLGGNARGLILAASGELLCGYSKHRLVVVKMPTNIVVLQIDLPDAIRRVVVPDRSSRIVAVTDHAIRAWDTARFAPAGLVQGLSNPGFAVVPK